LTKETDERVNSYVTTLIKKIESGEIKPSFKDKRHSLETRNNLSKKLSLNNKGGRCKWFLVNNNSGVEFKVQGTWELKFVKYLNVIDDDWIKIGVGNKEHSYQWKDFENKEHWYTPDFWSPKLEKYFEVKGYWWGEDKEKMRQVLTQNNIKLEIIDKKRLEECLSMVL